MIVDMFSNLSFYCPMIKNLDKGIEAAKKHWDSPIEGRYEFEGGFFTIMKGVTIGEGTVIAANSVVTHSLPAHCLASGNPAEVIAENIFWRP